MRQRLVFYLATIFAFTLIVWPSAASADDWNRATTAIFNQPVEIPGQVLPAGIYVFKLADFAGHNLVQVWNAEGNVLVATLLGWPDYLRESAPENRFVLEQQGPGEPLLLRTWFYRGNSCGQSFLYPKKSER